MKAMTLLWIGALAGAGFAFLTQAVLARNLTPQSYGSFSATLATVTLLSPLASFGLSSFWLKIFGKEGRMAIRWLSASFRFICISTGLTLFLLLAWAYLGPHDSLTTNTLLLLATHIVGIMFVGLLSSKLQIEERFTLLALWQFLPHLARLVLVIIVAYLADYWLSINMVTVVYTLVALVMSFVGVQQLAKMKERGGGGQEQVSFFSDLEIPSLSIPSLWNVTKGAFPLGLAGIFYLIYYQSDIILLKYLADDESAGVYNVAFTVMSAVYLFPSVIYQKFLLPKLHRWSYHDKGRFYSTYVRGNMVMLFFGLISMISLWMLAPWGIPFLFGSNYQVAAKLVVLLSWCAPFKFVSSSPGALMTTGKHINSKVKIMFIAALMNLVLNFILIPKFNFYGAAIATIATELLLLLLFLYYVKNYMKVNISF